MNGSIEPNATHSASDPSAGRPAPRAQSLRTRVRLNMNALISRILATSTGRPDSDHEMLHEEGQRQFGRGNDRAAQHDGDGHKAQGGAVALPTITRRGNVRVGDKTDALCDEPREVRERDGDDVDAERHLPR